MQHATPNVIPADPMHESTVVTRFPKLKFAWWIAFAAILIGGFLLAGAGYRHGLPYIDLGDEMTIWTIAHRYVDPSWPPYGQEYPPGIPVVSSLVQRAQVAFGDPYLNPAGTVEVLRLMSVGTFAVTLALVMLLAYRMAGPLAGLSAGLFWAVLPAANLLAKYSTVNVWVCAWLTASVLAGVEAFHRKSTILVGLSLLLALLATAFKWQGGAALGMAGLVCLSFWRWDRRRSITLVLLYLAIVGIFAYWAVFIHRALEGGIYYTDVQPSIPTPEAVLANLQYLMMKTGPWLIFGLLPLVGLALAAFMPGARRRLYGRFGLWTFPLIIIAFTVILSIYGAPVYDRHYLSVMPLLAVMAGIGLALAARAIWSAAGRYRWPFARLIGAAVLVGLVVAISSPFLQMAQDSLALAAENSRPDRRALFADWARSTATEGPLLITDPVVAAAVQTLYGYRGRFIDTPYNEGTSIYVSEDKITPEIITAKGIRYLIVSPGFDPGRLNIPLTRLISYEGGDERFRGTPWTAYYVGDTPPLLPDHGLLFGNEIGLAGFSLSSQSVCPGDSIKTRLAWRAIAVPARYYVFFLHLTSEKTGEMSWPINGQQLVSEARPTISWADPGEFLLGPEFNWSIPQDLPSGSYQLLIGLFDPVGNYRLLLPDGKHYAVLATMTVTNCKAG